MKKAALASFLKVEKNVEQKAWEEKKIRSSFQNNTTQNTTVLGEKKGKGWKKKGE